MPTESSTIFSTLFRSRPTRLPTCFRCIRALMLFTVMVDHPVQVDALSALDERRAELASKPLRVVVGVDCGYHRDGCDPEDASSVELVRTLIASPLTTFAGLYTHGGHSYDAGSADEIIAIGEAERDATVGFASALRALGLEVPSVGVWLDTNMQYTASASGRRRRDASWQLFVL